MRLTWVFNVFAPRQNPTAILPCVLPDTSIDCNGNKHGGRVSEGIQGAAVVVFGARCGASGAIRPPAALTLPKSPKSMRFNFSLVLYRICLFE